MFQPQAQFLEMYRAGMRTAADLAKTSLEHTERLQNRQLELLRSAIDENKRSASELSNVRSIDELMSLQARLATAQMGRMLDFWSGLWRSAGETTESVARLAATQVQEQGQQAAGQAREAAERARKAA